MDYFDNSRKSLEAKSVTKLTSVLSGCSVMEGMTAAGSANGVLLVVFPNTMGLVIYSPGLDSKSEVSARGMEFAKKISEKLKLK